MTDVARVIGLLHRADWTRLSMRAGVSDRHGQRAARPCG